MKKTFIKPVAKKYALNTKENIVSSINFVDGSFAVQFHTIHTNPANINEVWDETKGCYDILNEHYPIPVGAYTTVSFANNYTIPNVMANYDSFNKWYIDQQNDNPLIVTCHD